VFFGLLSAKNNMKNKIEEKIAWSTAKKEISQNRVWFLIPFFTKYARS
jgi:hypothetical protein